MSIKDPGASHVKMLVLATVAKTCNPRAVRLPLQNTDLARACLGFASGWQLRESCRDASRRAGAVASECTAHMSILRSEFGLLNIQPETKRLSWAGSVARKKSRRPAGVLDKGSAVRDAVEKLIADVYAGRLHPRVAAGLAPLLSLQLRAVEATDLEWRIDTIEKLLAKAAEAERKRTRGSARP